MAAETMKEDIVNKQDLEGSHVDENVTKTTDNQNKNINAEVEFDDLLSSAGEFGLYQVLLFFSTFPFYFYGVFVYFSQLFMTEVSPNHWCWIPELENLTDIERRTLAIPPNENTRFGYSQCHAYVANWSEVLLTGVKPNQSWVIGPCQNGWEFNRTEIPYPTISSEMEWVCDKKSYQASAQSIFFVGSIIGGFLIGWVADRFGRLPATIISNLLGCIGGATSSFARNYTEFTACRFLMGMGYDNCMMMVYLLILEYVAPKYRTLISNLSFALFYALAATSFPWIILACGHWKTISLVTSLPLAFVVFSPFFIPESPRWLLSKGRIDDAIKRILTIGRVNKKEIPTKMIEQFKLTVNNKKEEESVSVLELFKRPLLRKMFICICLEFICCTVVYDALMRSLGQLEFDFFFSFSLISFTEFPSLLIAAFIMDWMGRRWLTTISMTVSCIFSILTVFIGSGLSSVMCAFTARFTVNMAYTATVQWAVEMLPTSVRGSGGSIIHTSGYIATVLSPYIVYLEIYLYWLPLVVVGCIAGFGAVIALPLPETTKKDMPQTFDEAEDLAKNQRFWDMPCLSKKEKTGHENDCFEM